MVVRNNMSGCLVHTTHQRNKKKKIQLPSSPTQQNSLAEIILCKIESEMLAKVNTGTFQVFVLFGFPLFFFRSLHFCVRSSLHLLAFTRVNIHLWARSFFPLAIFMENFACQRQEGKTNVRKQPTITMDTARLLKQLALTTH